MSTKGELARYFNRWGKHPEYPFKDFKGPEHYWMKQKVGTK